MAGRGATCFSGQGISILLVPCFAEGEKKKNKTRMEIVSNRFLTPARAWERACAALGHLGVLVVEVGEESHCGHHRWVKWGLAER